MPVAALYDVHGNLPALDAVLAEVGEGDTIVVGGDVAAGPWPVEVLDRLRGLGDRVRWLRGNADRELFEPSDGSSLPPGVSEVLEWVRAKMPQEQTDFLAGLPLLQKLDVEGLGRVIFCHATPRSDEEILTRVSPDERWQETLAGISEPIVVVGHTHVQFDRVVGETRIVNAGSVGMPYEQEPGAYWVRLGPGVEHRRTTYDFAAAAAGISAAGWPDEWPEATPEEATEFFERIAGERV